MILEVGELKSLIFAFMLAGLLIGTVAGLVVWNIPVEVELELVSGSGAISNLPVAGHDDLASALGFHPIALVAAFGLGGVVLAAMVGLMLVLLGYRLDRGVSVAGKDDFS